jgi:hypothetical protein
MQATDTHSPIVCEFALNKPRKNQTNGLPLYSVTGNPCSNFRYVILTVQIQPLSGHSHQFGMCDVIWKEFDLFAM